MSRTEGGITNNLLRSKMPELDTLRGVAVLGVVFYHGVPFYDTSGLPTVIVAALVPLRYGWLGVDLFFVLSGFLITGILLDSKASPHYYKRFYVRRALRILPAYLLLLLLLLVVPRIGISDRQISWSFVGLSLLYLSNFTNFFGVALQFGPLWSLAVEEHFYLFWPAVVRRLNRRALACCALAVALVCPLLRLLAFVSKHGEGVFYTWMVADGLASGAMLAILCRTRLADRRSMGRFATLSVSASILLIALGAPLGMLSPIRQPQVWGATFRNSLFNLLFTGILGAALLLGTSRWSKLVQRPVLQFFGKISYGLYLVHYLVLDVARHFLTPAALRFAHLPIGGSFVFKFVRFLVAAAIATMLAVLSRQYFEERFLRLKDRFASASPEGSLSRTCGERVFEPIEASIQAD